MLSLAGTKKSRYTGFRDEDSSPKKFRFQFQISESWKIKSPRHMHHNSQPFKIDLNKKPFSKHKTLQTFKDDAQGFKEKHITKSSHIKKKFFWHPRQGFEPRTVGILVCWMLGLGTLNYNY